MAAPSNSTGNAMPSIPVWDLPTRIFHWSLVVLVVFTYLTGEGRGWLFLLHVGSGYLIGLLLLYRLIWGVVGSPHARFVDFVSGRAEVRRYVAALVRLRPPRFIGHNPLGGWMVVLMLTVLTLTITTGLFAASKTAAGPLAPWIGTAAHAIKEVHETLANFIVVLAVVHVLAVLGDWLVTGENLISPMIHGRKTMDSDVAAGERPLASPWRAIAVALLVFAAGWWAFSATPFSTLTGNKNADGGSAGSAEQEAPDD